MNRQEDKGTERTEEPSAWVNIGKIVLLVAILVAAWFVLEWLFEK